MRIHKLPGMGLATFTMLIGALLLSAPTAMAAGPPEEPLTGPAAGSITGSSAVLEGELNPGSSKAEVRWFFTYGDEGGCTGAGSSEEQAAEGEPNHLPVSVEVGGLQPNREYLFCLDATNAHGSAFGGAVSFTTEAVAPSIDGESASGLSQSDARLSAQVDPNNLETSWRFEIGTATSYTLGTIPATAGILNGFGDQEASVDLNTEGVTLAPNTEYHYQVIASSTAGRTEGLVAQGDQAFLTLPEPPVVSTGAASAVTTSAASLTGIVNPNNSGQAEQDDTTYLFQYGGDTGYGKQTLATAQVGEGTTPVQETVTLGGLRPGGTYHYRIVASNNNNNATPQIVYGQDEQFTTAGSPPPPLAGATKTTTPSSATTTPSTFPNLTAIAPVPLAKEPGETPSTTKSLTRAQKLTKALKACRKDKGIRQAKCEKQAHSKYGKTTKKKGK